MDEARIVCQRHEGPLGKPYFTYDWVGRHNAMVYVSDNYEIESLPWPMKVLEHDWSRRVNLCIRTDTRSWYFTWIKHRASNAFGWFGVRLLATAVVWGLADCTPGVSYSWRDLKIIKWITKSHA